MRRYKKLVGAVAVVAGVVIGVVAQPAPVGAATYRKPLASFAVPNPGVIYDASRWVVLSTGGWDTAGHIATAAGAAGPWRKDATHHLLTKRPAWASKTDHSVWAPSIVKVGTGHYVVYYAAVVLGQKSARCIGSGSGSSPTGPFIPSDRALACYKRSGANAYDTIATEGANFGLIDPTPARVGSHLLLTYKTQFLRSDKQWHTTIRMVELNSADPTMTAANPIHAGGGSVQLTNRVNKYIEENPVLVQHGSTFTLFTSYGWYGTCVYSTRYRQNASLWHNWLAKASHALPMPKHNTCGSGNAQVVRGPSSGPWRIFFNGHMTGPHTPFGLYAGTVTWSSGTPEVGRLY